MELQYIGSNLSSGAVSLYFFRICSGKSSSGISNSILVFCLALFIYHVPSSAEHRLLLVSRHMSLYEILVKQENKNISRTWYNVCL